MKGGDVSQDWDPLGLRRGLAGSQTPCKTHSQSHDAPLPQALQEHPYMCFRRGCYKVVYIKALNEKTASQSCNKNILKIENL